MHSNMTTGEIILWNTYDDDGVFVKVKQDVGVALFNRGIPIYLLHNDGTESLVKEWELYELKKHIKLGGEIGIQKTDIEYGDIL